MKVVPLADGATAADIRALSPQPRSVAEAVAAIVAEVRSGGDAALASLTRRFDAADPQLGVSFAAARADDAVMAALETAVANVSEVARAGLRPEAQLRLAQGHAVEFVDVPLRRAGAYVPGGRAPYVSTVVMCAVTARVAGVAEVVVCTPPPVDAALLAACRLCRVDEVHAVGGAQAIAALAYGTESIAPVDVVVGPGNVYVTEAKRQVSGDVAIDGLAGPSELVIVATEDADPELAALDLLAQAEHGPASLCALVSPDRAFLDAVAAYVEADAHPSVSDAPLAVVRTADAASAVALADEVAPEHLELVGAEAEALADHVRAAGCLFLGRDAATAFGDYVAGSNHVLPTGGAARFASALSAATFRRRMARVSLPPGAASRLAPAGVALARAEGIPVHGESMERRSGPKDGVADAGGGPA